MKVLGPAKLQTLNGQAPEKEEEEESFEYPFTYNVIVISNGLFVFSSWVDLYDITDIPSGNCYLMSVQFVVR